MHTIIIITAIAVINFNYPLGGNIKNLGLKTALLSEDIQKNLKKKKKKNSQFNDIISILCKCVIKTKEFNFLIDLKQIAFESNRNNINWHHLQVGVASVHISQRKSFTSYFIFFFVSQSAFSHTLSATSWDLIFFPVSSQKSTCIVERE